jgi:SpoVK/Ycf46/Vps4 family AAA+-type ATPase
MAEFDSIATSRGLGEDSTHNRRLLAELLLQLTLHKQQQNKGSVVVIAATNRLEDLDEAILRRFDCKVCPTLPILLLYSLPSLSLSF